MTWSVRVVATGRWRAAAYAGRHRFDIGAPVSFDSEAETVSALEYALAALAADLVNTFAGLARRRRVEVDAVEAVATGSLNNPLTVLQVVGEEGHPGLERVALKLYVVSPAAEEEVRRILEEARSLSPLARTLSGAVDLDIELDVTP
jgi:uncharacterized OsmC-like protein